VVSNIFLKSDFAPGHLQIRKMRVPVGYAAFEPLAQVGEAQ